MLTQSDSVFITGIGGSHQQAAQDHGFASAGGHASRSLRPQQDLLRETYLQRPAPEVFEGQETQSESSLALQAFQEGLKALLRWHAALCEFFIQHLGVEFALAKEARRDGLSVMCHFWLWPLSHFDFDSAAWQCPQRHSFAGFYV